MTDKEKQAMLDAFNEQKKKEYTRGKTTVIIIAVINVLLAIVSSLMVFSPGSIIIACAISVALFFGVSWVRYIYAVYSLLTSIGWLYILMSGSIDFSAGYAAAVVYIVFNFIFCIASGILLIWNKSVSEFLYAQKNG